MVKPKKKEFIKKIETANGGYPFEDLSSGRLTIEAINPEIVGLKIESKDEYKILRKAIQEKREDDFNSCLIPIINSFLNYYNFNTNMFPPLQLSSNKDLDEKLIKYMFPSTEAQFLYSLVPIANQNKKDINPQTLRFSQNLPHNLEEIANKPIWVQVLSKKLLKKIYNIDSPFDLFLSKKRYESIGLKMLEKLRKIYAPSRYELTQMSYKNQNNIRAKELIEFYETYMKWVLGSNYDAQKVFYQNQPTSLETLLSISELQSFTKRVKNGFEPIFGGKINQIIGDTIPIDYARATISPKIKCRDKISSQFYRNVIPENQLIHRTERKTDGDFSITYGIRGDDITNNPSTCAEVKIIPIETKIEAEFGSPEILAHYLYSLERIKTLKETIYTNNKMGEFFDNVKKLFPQVNFYNLIGLYREI